ncbi:hypothetical protein C8A01DRAFT_36620 [Parachaetomium inaequale]|uniref:Uncharacterized protein n=1 Tax=Parachaetomium inaequale TaxID=2588326 RepID=A0AAN6SRB2_9PEZI|nr:hypothetical protein C8A01DRAFT_36620 [Parachaetomium inaequale]
MRFYSLTHGFTCLALLQCLASSGVLAQTPAPDGPANFQGIYLNPTGAVETLNCDASSVFALSSTFAGCCKIGLNCNFPTACARGQPTNRKGGKWSCGQDRACYTMTVYAAYPDPTVSATESWVVHNCAKSWSASTIYRSVPSSLTTGMAGSASSSSSSTVDFFSSTTEASTTEARAGEITAPADPPEEVESQPSKAWIAGVVIGCLVAGAVLGGLGFWFVRRRKRGVNENGEHEHKGFTLHSASLTRLGGGWFAPPPNDDAKAAAGRANAVAVAEGVEMEGHVPGYGIPQSPQELASPLHAELETVSTEKKGYYSSHNV